MPMNKIEKLIKELCPNGVEWKKLGEVCQVLRGKRLTKSQLSETAKYKVYHGGIEPIGFYDKKNRDADSVMIINVGASAGTIGYSYEDFWSSDGCFCISHSYIFCNRFLYYYLISIEHVIIAKVRHAGIPTLDSKVIENIEIPLPPLPIQTEIVRILDKFVEQQEQLERLIELRKKQYEYYREEMLKPKEGEKWETKRLGEVCSDLYSGATPSTKIEKYWQNGTIPWMSSGEVNKGIVNKVDAFITQAGYDSCSTKIVPVGSVVIALAGQGKTRGTVALTQIELCTNQSLCALVPNLETTSGKYIFYYLRTQYSKLREVSAGDGNRGGLNLKMLKEYEINIPSLKIQNLIISKLDSFESSIATLTTALELSKKRYEYYRDKMMRF